MSFILMVPFINTITEYSGLRTTGIPISTSGRAQVENKPFKTNI